MLHETYRPTHWSDFIGNTKARKATEAATKRAKADAKPLAFLITGLSGAGKTTLSKLIAAELTQCPDMDVEELDGDKCLVETVRDLDRSGVLATRAWGGYRVVIVNECHAMSARAVQAWLTLLERLPRKSCVIFTTTEQNLFGSFGGPFSSRCIEIALTNQGLAQDFARRAQEIAERENLGGADAKAYLRLVQECKNNFRMVLSRIEAGEMMRAETLETVSPETVTA
jgi:replication-associated recombination protein RarA